MPGGRWAAWATGVPCEPVTVWVTPWGGGCWWALLVATTVGVGSETVAVWTTAGVAWGAATLDTPAT